MTTADLIALREQAGLTQARLADRMGWSQYSVARIEAKDVSLWRVGDLREYVVGIGMRVEIALKQKGE